MANPPPPPAAAAAAAALAHVSRKFAAMSNSRAMSGATLNSGMLRVVLQQQQQISSSTRDTV
jgi:hypothetical protein